ncbi:MAG TPA: DUF885 family protein, partial [Longimicrobiales bacterium]|nr:DUF885 family protein [Longimicrobiales bacterium]
MQLSKPAASAFALALLLGACHPAPEPRRPEPQAYEYGPTPQEKQAATQDFKAYARKFLDWYYVAHPVRATELGIHEGDGQLPDVSRDGVDGRIQALLDWLQKQDDLEPGMLDMPDQIDFRIIEYAIRAELLDLEEIRVWAREPNFYLGEVSRGVTGLVNGTVGSRSDRMRNLTARLESVPDMLAEARRNLTEVPQPWALRGTHDARQTAAALRGPVEAAFDTDGTGGPLLQSQFDAAVDRAATALDAFADWLADAAPRQGADYHLGRYIFLREMQYREHIQLTAAELDQLSTGAIQDLRAQIQKVAAEIDPGRTPSEILDSLTADTLRGDDVLAAARQDLSAARDFVVARNLVPLPDSTLPTARARP